MRRADSAAILAAAVLILCGCSSAGPPPEPSGPDLAEFQIDDLDRNGIEFLDGASALDAVLTAARHAGSVTMMATTTERLPPPEGERELVDGETVTVSYSGSARDFAASVSAGSVAGQFRVHDGSVLARGGGAFAALHGVNDAALTCVPDGLPDHAHWRPLLDPWELLSVLTEGTGSDSEVNIGTGAVIGNSVQLVIAAGDSAIGTLTVSATGAPLPQSLVAADPSGTGSFTFSEWGAVTLEAPGETCG